MNKKLIIIILVSLLSYALKAQDTIIINNNYKYKLGAKFISEQSTDWSHSNKPKQVYAGGIQFIVKIKNSKFSIESGIYKTTKACDYLYITPYWSQFVNGGFFKTTVFYHYMSIPVNFRFDTKVIYLSGGINFDYLFSKKANYSTETDSISYYGTDRKANFSVNINIGMEKQIVKDLFFFAEGRYYQTVTSSKEDMEFLHKSYKNIGFAIGINYALN